MFIQSTEITLIYPNNFNRTFNVDCCVFHARWTVIVDNVVKSRKTGKGDLKAGRSTINTKTRHLVFWKYYDR